MTFLRRLAVVLSVGVIGWWGAAQLDLLRPEYHPVVVAEGLLYGWVLTPLGETGVEGMAAGASGTVDRTGPRATVAPSGPAGAMGERAAAVAEGIGEELRLPAVPTVVAVVDVAAAVLPGATVAATAIPTATAVPTPTVTPLPTATPTLAPTPTVTPMPTELPPPALRHLAEKEYMLELINGERAKVGAPPVVLGDNVAAQLHAEASLAGCFSGHWGADGLKPYMRYSLTGGYQSGGENVSGLHYCIRDGEFYTPIRSSEEELREAMEGFMNSPGHRRQILVQWHKKVNIGLAWDRYNFRVVQHFAGDYVEYSDLPALDNGILSLAGNTKNGISFGDRDDLGLQIYYDPPPYPLTPGQLARTYCVGLGIQVAALRPSLTGNWFYTDHQFSKSQNQCPDPYQVPPDTPAPRSHDDAHSIARATRSVILPAQTVTGPWITASRWRANGSDFSVEANISRVTDQYGPGVYTVLVWGNAAGEDIVISEYSVFLWGGAAGGLWRVVGWGGLSGSLGI